MSSPRIGFIGAGQMATALGQGFVEAGLVEAHDMRASDPSEEARQRFASATGAPTHNDNRLVAVETDILFLAVKPNRIVPVLAELRDQITAEKLIVSIAAGIRLQQLADGLDAEVRLIRVMPNTPCLVRQGACGYSLGDNVTAEDGLLVERLLGSVGIVQRVDESLLDAVTGLSGSGPAFVYLMIEALSDGGVRMGLPRTVATDLAAQTLKGAAEMVLVTGVHPGQLKDQVTSPGGTTIAGIEALESGGLRAALIAAVSAATRRSIELGQA